MTRSRRFVALAMIPLAVACAAAGAAAAIQILYAQLKIL
jgi:hypothetical protein